MANPPRTYQTPPAGADAAGLEDYVVESADGRRIGTVVSVVERQGERRLVVEEGLPPVARDRRAARLEEVGSVDHDSLAVRLRPGAELVPAPGHVETDEADARRLSETGAAPEPVEPGGVSGPTDRSGLWFLTLSAFGLGMLTLLASVVVLGFRGAEHWVGWSLLAPAAVFFLVSGASGYRLWREPYSRRQR